MLLLHVTDAVAAWAKAATEQGAEGHLFLFLPRPIPPVGPRTCRHFSFSFSFLFSQQLGDKVEIFYYAATAADLFYYFITDAAAAAQAKTDFYYYL